MPRPDRWIVKSRFDNGSRMYNIADPDESIFMVRPDSRRLMPMSYVAPITTEYWDDDGSAEYRAMFGRIEQEGIVLEGVRPTNSTNQFAQIRSSPPEAR